MDIARPGEKDELRDRLSANPADDWARIRLAAFEAGQCNHAEYSFDKFGRVCPCGECLSDFGD